MGFLAALFLFGLAIAHLAIWLPRYDPERRPFDARDSWLMRRAEVDQAGARRAASVSAAFVAGLLTLSGIGALGGGGWYQEVAAGGAALSMLLAAAYFHPWLGMLLVVDLAVIAVAL